ncbi:12237_t:CDS:2, partial [Dentiscutata heterogama]
NASPANLKNRRLGSNPLGASLEKRRFGQEHTPQADATFQDVKDLAQGTDKEAQAGNLSGAMVRALLAKAPACDQQDRADEVIDLGDQLGDPTKRDQAVKIAQTYRQLERNTPNVGQPSELCNKKPRHKELDGLTQAQDPTGNNESNPPQNPTGTSPDNTSQPSPTSVDPKSINNDAFTNPVGGVQMPLIKNNADGTFEVNGNKFQNVDAAHGRQCDIQHNLCFNKFNGGDKSFSGADCDNQNNVCKSGDPVFAQ